MSATQFDPPGSSAGASAPWWRRRPGPRKKRQVTGCAGAGAGERCHGARRRLPALARRPVAILVGAVIAAGGISAAAPLLPATAAHAGTQTGGGLAGYNVKLTGWPGDEAGMSVAIGDVNGDGIPDYIIGDPDAGANGRPDSGSVYVIYGQASDSDSSGPPRVVNLQNIPLAGEGSSTLGYRIDGWSAGDKFGASVAVGDLNDAVNPATGEPIDDIVVGDPDGSPDGRQGAGEVYVIYGQPGESTPELDVSKMTASQGKLLIGWAAGDQTGASVAVGRFNDGTPGGSGCSPNASAESIAIGAPGASPGGVSQAGEVYDIFGEALGGSQVQIDLQDIYPTNGTPQLGYLIDGNWAGDQLGAAVADGGNVNGNCDDAILIGDPDASPNGWAQSGTTYVMWGQSQLSYPGTENVATAGEGYRIDGPSPYAHYGASVADAGDVDGDGTPDVIAGAPGYNNGAGEAIVTYGLDQAQAIELQTSELSSGGNPSLGFAIQGYTQDYDYDGTQGVPTYACNRFTNTTSFGAPYPNPASVVAEGDRAGTSVAGLGSIGGKLALLVGTPGWNDSAGAVSVIYPHPGRTQGNIPLYANGQGLPASVGYTITDSSTPVPESQVAQPYGPGNPWTADSQLAGQVQEQTEEAVKGGPAAQPGGFYTWLYCSNYMWEPGDQAGDSAAATGTGSGGLAVIGAPTSGTTPSLSWNGAPSNPPVWYDDPTADGIGGDVGSLGVIDSGEADWSITPGTGAVYILGF
ncbi:MAG TPA: integrin alpha [Streptosporangiaceae bacterium]|nr:integrin alpha [Streptosporangiaceae bacterium]